MSWSVKIGSIRSTAIYIHITFLLYLLSIFLAAGIDAAWYSTQVILLVFGSMLAHEFGHLVVGRAVNVRTKDVTLGPFCGVAQPNQLPEKLGHRFLVAAAGPLVNGIIGASLLAMLTTQLREKLPLVTSQLATMNLFIAVFNMIPALPMDGGRMLGALLSVRLGHVRATNIVAVIGKCAAVGLGALGLFYNPSLILIATFMFLGANAKYWVTTSG
jgi:Zn-dependent protease